MFEGLKLTADGLIMANEGIKKAVDADMRAENEHDDVRVTLELARLVSTWSREASRGHGPMITHDSVAD
jgi:hypothetical protein